MKRTLLAAALMSACGPALAQTVQQSSADGNRFGAVIGVPSTGKSYPSDSKSEARGVVLLSPAGVPYTASTASTAAAPTYLGGENGTSVATATNPIPVDNRQINGVAISTGAGTADSGTQRFVQQGYVGFNDVVASAVGANAFSFQTYRTPPAWATRFNCRGYTTQAGSVYIAETLAGGAAVVIASTPVTAFGSSSLSVPVVGSADTITCYVGLGGTAGTVTVASSFSVS